MSDLSPDDQILLVGRSDPKTGFDIWMLEDPLGNGAKKLTPFLQTPANEGQGRFSPTKPLRVAYTSEETGDNEIYVVSTLGAPAGKWADFPPREAMRPAGGTTDGNYITSLLICDRSWRWISIRARYFARELHTYCFKAPSPIVGAAHGYGLRRQSGRENISARAAWTGIGILADPGGFFTGRRNCGGSYDDLRGKQAQRTTVSMQDVPRSATPKAPGVSRS